MSLKYVLVYIIIIVVLVLRYTYNLVGDILFKADLPRDGLKSIQNKE
jgi:hypothetical protein